MQFIFKTANMVFSLLSQGISKINIFLKQSSETNEKKVSLKTFTILWSIVVRLNAMIMCPPERNSATEI